jgi:mono/diheme cytochrome c family protein
MLKKTRFPLIMLLVAVLALVALAAVSCRGSATTTTSASGTTGPGVTSGTTVTSSASGAVDAAALFAQECQGCHGNIPTGSADVVKAVLQNGKGGMPAFAGKLTADQITALANYVASGGK